MVLRYAASASIALVPSPAAGIADTMSDRVDPDNNPDNAPIPEEDAAPAMPPRKKARMRIILLVVAVILLVGGGLWFLDYERHGKYQQTTNDAYIQSDAIVVSSKVAGYVTRVLVGENQTVRAGQPLVEIDPRDYRAQAAQATAQIGVAQAGAEGIRAQIQEQMAAIDRARADVAAAESRVAFAHSEVTRYAPLAASGAESGERLAQLRDQERQAAAQLASARAALAAAQRRVGTLNAQIGQSQAQAQAAQAQLAAANVNLGSTRIVAASDGRIGNKSVEVGQYVQPGLRLMSVVPTHNLYIEANFKETQVALMRVGQPVTIKVDALDGVKLHGRVESFSPGTGAQFSLLPPQNATGNFTKIVQRIPVRIAIDAGPQTRQLLLPGMSVEVTVDTLSARGAREQIEREEKARARGRQ